MVKEKLKVFKDRTNKYSFKTKDDHDIRIEHKDRKLSFGMSKWEKEVDMELSLDMVEQDSHTFKDNKVELDDGKTKTRAFPIDKRSTKEFYGDDLDQEQCNDGGIRFEIELSEKPKSNVWNIPVKAKNLRVYYQPALTKEQIDDGFRRPINVVGSYAVFHESKKNNKYKTGKFMHVYRPIVLDANGKKTWGNLEFNKELNPTNLKLTVPQKFLDEAVYPVTIDPDFGYDTIGGSYYYIAYKDIQGMRSGTSFEMPSGGGSASSLSAYVKVSTGTATFDCKAYINQKDSVSSGSHGQIATATNTACAAAAHWEDFTLGDETLTGGNDYILNVVGDENDGTDKDDEYQLAYDTTTSDAYYREASTWGSEESPWVEASDGTTIKESVYVTYTTDVEKDLSEEYSFTDSALKETTRSLSEEYSFVDAYSRIMTKVSTLSEEFSLSDGDTKSFIRLLAESFSTSDAYSRIWDAGRIYSESQSLSDTKTRSVERTLDEENAMVDDLDAGKLVFKELLEEFSFADLKIFATIKLILEQLGLSDGDNYNILRLFSESFAMTGDVDKGPGRSLSEAFVLADSKTLDPGKGLNEEFSLSDSRLMDVARSMSETFGLSDDLDAVQTMLRILSETFGLVDSYARAWTTGKVLSENISMADLLSFSRTLELLETLNLSDGDDILKFIKNLTESFNLEDNFIKFLTSWLQSGSIRTDIQSIIQAEGISATLIRQTETTDSMGGVTAVSEEEYTIYMAAQDIIRNDRQIHDMGLAFPGTERVFMFHSYPDSITGNGTLIPQTGDLIKDDEDIYWRITEITAEREMEGSEIFKSVIIKKVDLTQ